MPEEERVEITGIYKCIAGFKIRSKQDARRFLTEIVCAGTNAVILDMNLTGWHYVISRNKKDKMAAIAHERDGKDIFEPDLMRSDDDAVEMAYNARRSINQMILSNDN